MLNMSTPSELKSPCVPRNGMVKLPPQPNGLGSASITKGTPAAKNRLCQSSSVPGILPPPSLPYHLDPLNPLGPSLLGPDLDHSPLTALKPPLRQVPLTFPKPHLPLTLPLALLPPLERQLALDEKLLNRLLWYFTTAEKCVLAQVCRTWRKVLYQSKFWEGVTPILHAKELYALLPGGDKEFVSLQAFALRGFQAFCLVGVSDLDICEFIDNYPLSKKGVKSVSLKRSTITDAGLEVWIQERSCGGQVSQGVEGRQGAVVQVWTQERSCGGQVSQGVEGRQGAVTLGLDPGEKLRWASVPGG
ncbi:F-box/LRR-repeat protein 16 [Oncorhynchus kisutch]|uniref:F-box/LRR-repeat protein 16 n=1 Tax=Oncorhynchus kisutch TaxID=8019 RepID=UPI00099F5310|nr:F-box/LRR-repeat protein 16 [Oncorhynchus kisutch]